MTNDTLSASIWSTKFGLENNNLWASKNDRSSIVFGYILITTTLVLLLLMFMSLKNCFALLARRRKRRQTLERAWVKILTDVRQSATLAPIPDLRRHTWASLMISERTEEVFV